MNATFYLLLVFSLLCCIDAYLKVFHQTYSQHRSRPLSSFKLSATNSRDISPSQDGGILKSLLINGDGSKGYPVDGDAVAISFIIRDWDGNMLHNSTAESEEDFTFVLGHEPSHVIEGWEHGVRTMFEGETSKFRMTAQYGFQVDSGLFEDMALDCEITLHRIMLNPRRKYRVANPDENTRDYLMDKINSGELNPLLDDIMIHDNKPSSNADVKAAKAAARPSPGRQDWSSSERNGFIPSGPFLQQDTTDYIPSSNNNAYARSNNVENSRDVYTSPSTASSPEQSPSPQTASNNKARFFNEAKHRLDPARSLSGQGDHHFWYETTNSIEVHLSLPTHITTVKDLQVNIKPTEIKVQLPNEEVVLFGGPLHGKVRPSECMWAIEDDDSSLPIRGPRLLLSLEKEFGHLDLWATVFKSEYLSGSSPWKYKKQ